jgi:hypothetical protein
VIITKSWSWTGESSLVTGQDGAALHTYLADLVRPFGLALRPDWPGAPRYAELADTLLGPVRAGREPVDLIVFAYAVPDAAPWESAASWLSSRCPGAPLAFAVCDQGAAAAFTGLRLIEACPGPARRALLVIAEQPGVPYELPVPAAVPVRAAVVTLLCEGGPSAEVRLHSDVAPARAASLLAAELAALAAGCPGALTLIAGNGLTETVQLETIQPESALPESALPESAEVILAPAGQPLTGAWLAAAGRLAQPDRGPLVIADYDPLLGNLCLCAI